MCLWIGNAAGEPWLWREVFGSCAAAPMPGNGSPRDALCPPPSQARNGCVNTQQLP